MTFTNDEMNLMCIYNRGTRQGLIDALSEMRGHLGADEKDLRKLTMSTMGKLMAISDKAFDRLELVPDFSM